MQGDAPKAVIWRGVGQKRQHFIFRKSEMCLGMRGGYRRLSWQLSSDGLYSAAHVCDWSRKKENSAALLHPSLITLNPAGEMAEERTATVHVGSG